MKGMRYGGFLLWTVVFLQPGQCQVTARQAQLEQAFSELRAVLKQMETTVHGLDSGLEKLAYTPGSAPVVSRVNPQPARGIVFTGSAPESAATPIPVITDWQDAGKAYAEGAKAEDQRRYSDAVNSFSAVLRLDPTNDAAYFHRGLAYLQQGENARAIGDLSEALRLQPQNARAYVARATALANSGNESGAISDLDEALQRSPDPAAFQLRARLYRSTSDPVKAISDFSSALKLAPSPELYSERAAMLRTVQQNEAALHDCQKAVKLDAQSSYGYLCRAASLLPQGHITEAITDLQVAVRLKPELTEARELLDRLSKLPSPESVLAGQTSATEVRTANLPN